MLCRRWRLSTGCVWQDEWGEYMAVAVETDVSSLEMPSPGQVVRNFIIGVLFIAFSIPIALIKFGHTLGWSWVSQIGSISNGLLDDAFGATSSAHLITFGNMWSVLLKGVLVYVVALALLSLRHQRMDLLTAGVLSLALGTAVLNLFAWAVYLFILLLTVLAVVVLWIFSALGFVLLKVIEFLAFIGAQLLKFFAFLLSSPWLFVVGVLVLALVIYLAVKYRDELIEALIALFWIALSIGIAVGAIFLLGWLIRVLAPLWAFLAQVFAAILHFLGGLLQFLGMVFQFLFRVFSVLVVVFLVGYVIWGVGSWVADLFNGAWHAGNGRRGVTIGALAIGTALALILLETNLIHSDFFPFFPTQAASFIGQHLHEVSPLFDLIVALLVIGVSILGILRNLGQLQPEPTWGEFHTSIFMAGLGIIIGVGLLIIASLAGGGDQN